jgi:hypothetical protein
MGFIFFAAWAGSFLILAGPAIALAVVLQLRAPGRRTFWSTCAVAALLALAVRVALLSRAHVAGGGVAVWPTLFAIVLHVPLIASVPVAALGLLGLRIERPSVRQIVAGTGAGIAASVPIQILVLPAALGQILRLLELRAIY